MKEFLVAAKAADAEEEEVLEFAIAGEEFRARVPSTARIAMFVATINDEETGSAVAALFVLLKDLLLDDGYKKLRRLISDGVIDMSIITGGDDLNEQGLVDWIISQATARPTESPSDSSESPAATGQRSTGRSRGRGSTS